MADDACFIFFNQNQGLTLDSAAEALSARGLSVERGEEELLTYFPGKPRLRVALAMDRYVQAEAEEFSQGTPFSVQMSACSARFEILIDDLDAVLDEINTLIDVQDALQELSRGFIYSTWNGEVSAFDSGEQ